MERITGTISRGLRAQIIKQGDDLKQILVDTVLKAQEQNEFTVRDKDIIALTESILARSQGNYCTVDDIAADVKEKFGDSTIGVIFPILRRNRFAIVLRGFARGAKKIVLQLGYPSDEVGNHLVDYDALDAAGVDPYEDVLTEEEFVEKFGRPCHTFTGVDYVSYYKNIIQSEGCEVEIIFANKPKAVLAYTDSVINCDIHTRFRTKRLLKAAGAKKVYGMDDIMTVSRNGSGYNDKYGLLGSNKATEESIKLFPINCMEFVESVQKLMFEKTGKLVEVMVYGDGAFKDPIGKIWELADPVVSPGYTDGLEGAPNELKLKYLADNKYADLKGDELKEAIKKSITEKDSQLKGQMASEGTTPRRLADLVGSLADLTSGSGDKGTPFVYVQGYFDNYTD